MKRLITAVALAASVIAGCTVSGERPGEGRPPVGVWADSERGVTCYLYGDNNTTGKSISCVAVR